MNIYATRIGSAPGTARTVHVATPEFDKQWYEAYVADRRARGVNPYGVHMDGDPMNGGRRHPAEPEAEPCCPKGHDYVEGSWRWHQPAGRNPYRLCLVCVALRREREKKAYEAGPVPPRTHCVHGHEMTEANTYVDPRGKHHCRRCARDFQVKYRARKAGRPVAPRAPVPPRTHCVHGHEMTEANTYVDPRGTRECRECKRAGVRRAMAKKRAASLAKD